MTLPVMKHRKLADVPYPHMYASREECAKDPKKHLFNCVQRGHQNTLENYPGFLVLLASSSLFAARWAAVCGAIWMAGRYMYAAGYSTGKPESRMWGSIAYIGILGMLGICSVGIFGLITGA
jgi:glutathione S-transferase